MSRAGMVLKAAKAMFLGECGAPVALNRGVAAATLTEEDAWKDADEFAREIYLRLANAAYVSFGATVRELQSISRGACLCRKELHRDSRNVKYRDTDSVVVNSEHCSTCGGSHGP